MKALALGVAVATMLAASPAAARDRQITPYIEVGQAVSADLNSDEVLTYSELAAGVDGQVRSRRVEIGVSYRYQHDFSESRGMGDEDSHSGLARALVRLAPGLQLDGGALATRTRSDIRGADVAPTFGHSDDVSNVYAVYGGPSLATNIGPVGASAGYRFGYVKVTAPDDPGLAPGQPRLDLFDDDRSQAAQASLSVKSGVWFPFGVTLSGAWARDDASQLDQRFDDKFVRGDVTQPVSGHVALTAGAGYEKLTISQKSAEVDANGAPVTDSNGRFVTDEASARRIAYNTDGLFWDAGVIWRPSPRTSAEAHIGRRYGSMSYTGLLSYQPNPSVGLNVRVYDGVTTFGQQLVSGLAGLPTSFTATRDALTQQFTGCVYGTNGAAGGCLNSALQSIATDAYRARGVHGTLSLGRGRYSFGIGAGYESRRFYAPGGEGFSVDALTDRSLYGQAFANVQLTGRSGINADLFANWYDSGIAGAPTTFGGGATGTYYLNFGHLGATASLGLYGFDQGNAGPNDVTASGLLGMHYQF